MTYDSCPNSFTGSVLFLHRKRNGLDLVAAHQFRVCPEGRVGFGDIAVFNLLFPDGLDLFPALARDGHDSNGELATLPESCGDRRNSKRVQAIPLAPIP